MAFLIISNRFYCQNSTIFIFYMIITFSGGDWIFEPGNSNQVYKALKKKIRELKNCYVVEFQAESTFLSID